ncbi:hypothetical protein [Liquorilactobacillus ghanensis]|uniref:hypothetical protein n=1 Tax=Liquorilactobacillus ghanensis TaxID=399370 RepID=UPI0039E7EBF4
MTLTRRKAIAMLTVIEEKHKQDGDSFWIHRVKGNEKWLLEIREALTRDEIKAPVEHKHHAQKDLTKDALIWEIKHFHAKSKIARKYSFKSPSSIDKLLGKYDLEEMYDDYRIKSRWVVVQNTKTNEISIETPESLAKKLNLRIAIAKEIIKVGSLKEYLLFKYPQWIKQRRKEHEYLYKRKAPASAGK